MKNFLWLTVVGGLALLGVARPASAVTYTWNGVGGSGSWLADANWSAVPAAGTATILVLDGTVQTSTTQDRANPFQLNSLQIGTNAANGFTVGGSFALQFAGTAPSIRQNSSGSGSTISAPISTTGTFTLAFSGTGTADLTVNGGINTGTNAISKSGSYTLILGGTNTFGTATATTGLSITGGTVRLASAGALTSGRTVNVAGASSSVAGTLDLNGQSVAMRGLLLGVIGSGLTQVTGGSLALTNGITLAGDSTTRVSQITSNVSIGSTTQTFDLGAKRSAADVYNLVMTGSLSGDANSKITVNGASGSILLLTKANSQFGGTLALNGPVLATGAANAVGTKTMIDLGSASGNLFRTNTLASSGLVPVVSASYSTQVGGITGTGASGLVQIDQTGQSATLVTGFADTTDYAYAGKFSVQSSASQLAKVGVTIFTLSGATGTFGGSLSVRDGTLAIQDNGNIVSGGSFAPQYLEVLTGATVNLDSITGVNSVNRLDDRFAIQLKGGAFQLLGNGSAATTETVAALTSVSGQSSVVVMPGGGQSAVLTFGSLNQGTRGGTLFFPATQLGSAAPGADLANIFFTAAPTTVGGNGTFAQTNTSIIPNATADTTGSGSPDSFVGYDAVNGVRPITSYATSFGNATNNVSLGVSGATVSAATTANALRLAGGVVTLNFANLTITSGALLATTSTNSSLTATPTAKLGFGSDPFNATTPVTTTAYITVADPASTMVLGASVVASNFSKSGAGKLSLQNGVALGASPTVAVNAGNLELLGGSFTAASGTLTYQVSKTATLSTGNFDVGNTNVLSGNGTVVSNGANGISIGNGATIRPSALGGPDASLASPGTLTITGKTTFGSGGTYEFYISSVVGAQGDSGNKYLRSLITTNNGTTDTGTLNVAATSANKFNIKVTPLQLSNALGGPVYDADAGTYAWTIAHFGGGITNTGGTTTNNVPNNFNVVYNPADFAGANLSVSLTGNDVILNMVPAAPVPEPASILGLAAAGLGLAGWVRRRRNTKGVTAGNKDVIAG